MLLAELRRTVRPPILTRTRIVGLHALVVLAVVVTTPDAADARRGDPPSPAYPFKAPLDHIRGPQVCRSVRGTQSATRWMVQSLQPQVCTTLNRLIASGKRGPATFDADGTLWGGDVGEGFFTWMLRNRYYPAQRIPELRDAWQRYKAGTFDGDKMYELMATGMAGMKETEVKRLAATYFNSVQRQRIYRPMQALVGALSSTGFTPWVVSGSPWWVVAAGAKHFGIPESHVIGLAVRVDGSGRLTDEIIRPVPWKEGKAERIMQALGRRPVIAAGNSTGDAYMLKIASELPLVINPAPSFLRTAEQRGWAVNHFTREDEMTRRVRAEAEANLSRAFDSLR
jgi:phosphoserine phosphatase